MTLDEVCACLNACEREGAHLVLDEAFLDFTDAPSAVALCAAHPRLIVARSLTKMYAIAGLRLGYGICAETELSARLRAGGAEWAVSTPAQLAGVAALADSTWAARTRAFVAEQRARLAAGLARCGMEHISGEANFLLFRSPLPLFAPLLQRGFLVRACESFGLDSRWCRVAVRTEQDNAALLAAIHDVMRKHGM